MPEAEANEQADVAAELEQTFGAEALAGVEPRKRTQIPAGRGVLKVTNAYLNRSKQKQRLQLTAECMVLEHDEAPECMGMTYYKVWGLVTEQNLQWLAGDLENLDVKMATNGKDFIRVATELIDKTFEVTFAENEDKRYPPTSYINEGALMSSEYAPPEADADSGLSTQF